MARTNRSTPLVVLAGLLGILLAFGTAAPAGALLGSAPKDPIAAPALSPEPLLAPAPQLVPPAPSADAVVPSVTEPLLDATPELPLPVPSVTDPLLDATPELPLPVPGVTDPLLDATPELPLPVPAESPDPLPEPTPETAPELADEAPAEPSEPLAEAEPEPTVPDGPVTLQQVADVIGATALHARGITGQGVGVALIDTGVVPVPGLDVPGAVINGPDISFESQISAYRYMDTFGHGTHMAGIIAGRGADATSRGIAPGAHLVNIKVAGHDGAVDVTQVIAAIDWTVAHAAELGIRVINLSYGTTGTQDVRVDPLVHAVEQAWRAGIVVVVAGGNEGFGSPALNTPATHPGVIAVGASDLRGTATPDDDVVSPYSSHGDAVRPPDFVAPGTSILSLRDPGSTIDQAYPHARAGALFVGSGSSQSAAVTSGAVALLLQMRPHLTPDQVRHVLVASAANMPGEDRQGRGAGRIDVLAASERQESNGSRPPLRTTGTGSLDATRAGDHVTDGGVDLVGERDIFGRPWVGAVWATASRTATSWDGGSFNGAAWTGGCFCTSSFAGPAWSPTPWTHTWSGGPWPSDGLLEDAEALLLGDTLSGHTWSGHTWSGHTWSGHSWSGHTWSGHTWSGHTWSGHSWSTGMWG